MIKNSLAILLLTFILAGNLAFPAGVLSPDEIHRKETAISEGGDKKDNKSKKSEKPEKKKKVRFKKLKTILLTILLGHFGVHRLYLGTNWKVPLFYTLTLGGGLGLLPLIDLFCVIFAPDISVYEGVSRFFMWVNGS